MCIRDSPCIGPGAQLHGIALNLAIRRLFRPGSKFEVMLCLVGGQGAGKSTFFRLLAGKDEWFSDDLKKLDDENAFSYTHLDVYKRQGLIRLAIAPMLISKTESSWTKN